MSGRKVRGRKMLLSSPAASVRSSLEENSQNSVQASETSEQLTLLAGIVKNLAEVVGQSASRNAEPSLGKFRNEAVPAFCPEDSTQSVERWLNQIEELKQLYRWDEATTVYHATNKLKGMAQVWYQGLSSVAHTWEEWKSMLQRAFPCTSDYCQRLEAMMRRKKMVDETMMKYFYDKMALINQIGVKGEDAVSCVIGGIRDTQVQASSRAGGFKEPEDLLKFLRTFQRDEVAAPSRRGSSPPRRGNQVWKKAKHQRLDVQKKNAQKTTVTCFSCREVGHFANQCPTIKDRCPRCRLARSVCKCGKVILKIDGTNAKYFKDATVNGHCVRAYVDMGSSCNTVKLSESERLELEVDGSKTLTLRGFGNGITPTLGEAEARVEVDAVELLVPMLVVADEVQSIPVIIGQPFTDHPGVSLTKDDQELKFTMAKKNSGSGVGTVPKKITFWAKEAQVIPAFHVGHVQLCTDAKYIGDVYVEDSVRMIAGNEHLVPSCVGSVSESKEMVVSVANVSSKDLVVRTKKPFVRGTPCQLAASNEEAVLRVQEEELEPFSALDVCTKDLSEEQHAKLVRLLNEYRVCFAQNMAELGVTRAYEMQMHLTDDKPVTYRPYRLSFSERTKVKEMVQELIDCDVVKESASPFSSPILLVKKKDGSERLCVDYRKLNSQTTKDKYPLPRIDDQLDRLRGCEFFTSLDLASGYYQIRMAENSQRYTSFVTPDGQYEFLRLPFGLTNAPSVFQRMIDRVLGPYKNSIALAYMDDVLIPSKDVEEGMINLEKVLKVFKTEGLTLKLSKCQFFEKSISYLGFEISSLGVRPGQSKIRAVQEFAAPINQHAVRQFLGLASYFRRFVRNFARKSKPLSMLLKKDQEWTWGTAQEEAFQALKVALVERPILSLYNPAADTQVHTDASKLGVAGILLQQQDNGVMTPVAYYSRQTNPAEWNYHSFELETLAVVESLKKFRVYLIGLTFKVVTDCNSLKMASSKRDLIPRIARWWLQLQEFTFTVEYRAGTSMAHVDALSRNPSHTESPPEEVEVLRIETADWILSAQLTDEKIVEIRGVLAKPPQTQHEKDIHREYVLKQDRVFRKTLKGEQWVVPRGARNQVVRAAHDELGHFSVEKTLQKLTEAYWFPKMRVYVQRYISCCMRCLYNKRPAGKRPGFLHPIPKEPKPFHTVHVDFLGPFPKSTRGNCHILLAVDGFTKFTVAKPVKTTSSAVAVNFMRDRLIAIYGVPTRIITDRGAAFTAKHFTNFCNVKGIKHVLNAVATPRANGQVERYNRTLMGALASTTEDEKHWDTHVSSVQFAINTVVNKATGKTPSELLFGYVPQAPGDSFIRNEIRAGPSTVSDMKGVRAAVAEKISSDQQKQKERFDRKRKAPPEYKEGDMVLIQKQSVADGTSRKLVPPFAGPMAIKKVLPVCC